jgi:DNA-binding transcriptional regulator YiaG
MDEELDIDKAIESFDKTVETLTAKKPHRLRVTKVHFAPAPLFQPSQIVSIRKAWGLSQEAFAEALNVRRDTIASCRPR